MTGCTTARQRRSCITAPAAGNPFIVSRPTITRSNDQTGNPSTRSPPVWHPPIIC